MWPGNEPGNVSNAGATFDVNDEGQPAIASPGNQGPLAAVADLEITEINDPGDNLSEDWFEIINNGTAAWVSGVDPDLYYDDDSQDPGAADIINGITDIKPGERVIVVIGTATDATAFSTLWSPDYNLTGIEIGYTDGSGLGQSGDGVTLWNGDPNSGGTLSDFETYPNASANGGQSYDLELIAFSVVGNAGNAAATSTVNDQSQAAIASPGNQGPLTLTIDLQITEIWPGQSGTDLTEDWFEIYNAGSEAWVSGSNPDLFYDDESADPADAVAIQGIIDIQPGESVVVILGVATDVTTFNSVWAPDYDLTGIEIGHVEGSGLGGGGDAVTLWLGDPSGSGLLLDSEGYPSTELDDGKSYDVVIGAFSEDGVGSEAPGSNIAVATTAIGGSSPAVGSPGNQGPVILAPTIAITEFMNNAEGEDDGREFVELYNYGSNPIDVTGWTVTDEDSDSYTFPTFTIQPSGFMVLVNSGGLTETQAKAVFEQEWFKGVALDFVFGMESFALSNSSDEIIVSDGDGNVVWSLAYGNDESGEFGTFHTAEDLSAVTNVYGSKASPGVVRQGNDNGTTNLLGYEENDTTTDPNAVLSDYAGIKDETFLTSLGIDTTFYDNVDNGSNASPGAHGIPSSGDIDIQVATTLLSPFLSLSAQGPSSVSGVINDPTDPAFTIGIPFAGTGDADDAIGDLTVTATSSNQAVVPDANLVYIGNADGGTLTIEPTGVGLATITVTLENLDGATDIYTINYAASAASIVAGTSRFHTGAADGSTAIPVDSDYMWVGDDEDQTIRLYNRNNSGLPITEINFNSDLGSSVEIDIEGSAQNGNNIYWIGSTANTNRSVLFSTVASGVGDASTLGYVDKYTSLNADLLAWDSNNDHGLGANFFGLSTGFEIEALTFGLSDDLAYIGFRDPIVNGKALLLPVTNFASLPGAAMGSANFGSPIQLDLGGRSLRSMEFTTNGWIIIAGPAGTVTDFKLYTWSGSVTDSPELRNADLNTLDTGGSFEGIVEMPSVPFMGAAGDAVQIQLMSDLGATMIYNDGTENKDQRREWKKFRTDVVTLGPVVVPPAFTDPLINEFVVDHTGSDTEAFIEILGDPNTDYSAFTLLEIEGDSGSTTGHIDAAITLGTTDNSGYWVDDEDAENGSVTLLLVEGFTGAVGDDIDTNDDGTIDNAPWSRIVDGIATSDGGATDQIYAVDLPPNFDGNSFQPGGASRIPNGTDTDTALDWVRNDYDGTGIPVLDPGTPEVGEALNTPGVENQLVLPPLPDLQITEIWPGNEPGSNLTSDWFEITNTGDIPWTPDLGELYFDDESQAPADADLISDITAIAPGEVVVVVDDTSITEFLSVWESSYNLTGIQIGTYAGAGLGQGGDGVTLWIGDPTAGGTLADYESYPDANNFGGQSYDVDLAAFSTIGNTNNAGESAIANDEGQFAVASPGNQGPLTATCSTEIDTQPQAITICVGEPVSFDVGATTVGTLSYQWQVDMGDGNGFVNLGDASKESVLSFAFMEVGANGNQYRVIVTSDNETPDDGADDCSITSDVVTLTVNGLPQEPGISTVLATCNATGEIALSSLLQDQKYQISKDNGITFQDFDTFAYVLPQGASPALSLQFKTVNTNTGCESEVVMVKVPEVSCEAPCEVTITDQPEDASICTGEPVSFNVRGMTMGALTYQWQVDMGDGNGFVDLGDASKESVLSFAFMELGANGNQYRVSLLPRTTKPRMMVPTIVRLQVMWLP